MASHSDKAKYNVRHTLWKWHLYAGLFVSPILIVVALTGALLVFDEETDRWLRPDLWVVSPGEVKLNDAQVAEAVAKKYPDAKIFSYDRPSKSDRPYLFWLMGDYVGFLEVFVDPYTGNILGDRLREKSFVRVTEQLHRRLLAGKWGSMVVDLTTGWTIVLLLTGLYLWWPKNSQGLRHGLTIKLRSSLKKFNWQFHNTVGFYSFALLLLLCLTGMVVSEVTGSMYRAAMFSVGAFPQSLISPPKSVLSDSGKPVSLNTIIDSSQQAMNITSALNVRFPRDAEGSYLMSTHSDGSHLSEFQAIIVDQYNGNILEELTWDESHPLMKVRSLSLAIHFGSIYGLPTKILALLGCLVIPIICITGYLIWWWKRPSKSKTRNNRSQSGTDKVKNLQGTMPTWLRGSVIVFCLVFPAVGVSATGIWMCKQFATQQRAFRSNK